MQPQSPASYIVLPTPSIGIREKLFRDIRRWTGKAAINNAMGNNQVKKCTKSRRTAYILACIPIYGLSLHYLYLKKYIAGVTSFLLAGTLIPTILGFIQGYKLYKMSDLEFQKKYINSSATFPLF